MHWKDSKYLMALLTPIAAYVGITFLGWWSPGSFYLGFIIIPVLELIIPPDSTNLTAEVESERSHTKFFDWLLYLSIPILYGLIYYGLQTITQSSLNFFAWFGLLLNLGIIAGTQGINVAHELGHRTNKTEQWLAKLLLLPCLNMHFFIEHNKGHHRYVATPADPATAKKNESIYLFFLRSITKGYRHAWLIEINKLKKIKKPFISLYNEMLRFQILQLLYLGVVWYQFGTTGLISAVIIGLISILLLEAVNYVEHYGLLRKKDLFGNYERVQIYHSWNSDHVLGRIFLYELTRHSDHHYNSTRPYQILRHHDQSPQLPLGYPGSIVLALVPPWWFKVMNHRIPK